MHCLLPPKSPSDGSAAGPTRSVGPPRAGRAGASCCAISSFCASILGVRAAHDHPAVPASLSSVRLPKIGQGIAGRVRRESASRPFSARVVGIPVMFQGCSRSPSPWPGVPVSPGDRGPGPGAYARSGWWPWPRVLSGAAQGVLSPSSCCRSVGRCTAPGVHATCLCTGGSSDVCHAGVCRDGRPRCWSWGPASSPATSG